MCPQPDSSHRAPLGGWGKALLRTTPDRDSMGYYRVKKGREKRAGCAGSSHNPALERWGHADSRGSEAGMFSVVNPGTIGYRERPVSKNKIK